MSISHFSIVFAYSCSCDAFMRSAIMREAFLRFKKPSEDGIRVCTLANGNLSDWQNYAYYLESMIDNIDPTPRGCVTFEEWIGAGKPDSVP